MHRFNITDSTKTNRVVILCEGTLQDLLQEAKKFGIHGTAVCLESNGCQIMSDQVLEMSSNDLLVIGEVILNVDIDDFEIEQLIPIKSLVKENYGNTEVPFDFFNFSIPWHKMSDDTKEALNNDEKINDMQYSEIVNETYNEMKKTQKNGKISSKEFRKVVSKMSGEFPCSFLDKTKDGKLIQDSAEFLVTKFVNKENYKNNQREAKSAPPNRKKMKVLMETTTNFKGPVSTETSTLLLEKKKWLQDMWKSSSSDSNPDIIFNMNATFGLQRELINIELAEIRKISEEFPYLLKKELIFNHFFILMGYDIDRIQSNIVKEEQKIIKFVQQLPNKTARDFVSKIKEPDSTILMFKYLFANFKEDSALIFKQYEFGTPLDTIVLGLEVNTPFIAVCGCSVDGNNTVIYLFVEKVLINSTSLNFIDAVQQMWACFFNFNMMFPEKATKTLLFMQRHFAEYFTTSTRGDKMHSNKKSTVQKFIINLNKYDIGIDDIE